MKEPAVDRLTHFASSSLISSGGIAGSFSVAVACGCTESVWEVCFLDEWVPRMYVWKQ